MTSVNPEDIRAAVNNLLDRYELTWEEFERLGEEDELDKVNADLEFVYRALLPLIIDPPAA
ncbi:MAG: hypothetical protein HKN07_13385 [Acidimicrobiia bacterium]|nr:hypothetical protein [Acidimicrobiia bacterium]